MNQPGSIQQNEQEAKTNSEEDEQKTVSEQFDNTQIEPAATPVPETEKTGDLSAIIDTVIENEEKDDVKEVDTDTPVASELVTTDSAVEMISDNDSIKVTVDDENIIPITSPTVNEKSENDSVMIESSTTESKVVEEATA